MSAPLSPPGSPPAPLREPAADDDDSDNGKAKPRCGLRAFSARAAGLCPPPSFNDPASGSTRPCYLFPLFIILNVATMTDRAIVAGAGREFSAFVSGASDSPPFVRDSPDAGIGLLQAAFIFGYSVALLLSGHYVHVVRWKALVLGGLCVWWAAVLGSGAAKRLDSFYVLLLCRMATGVSEAAFQVVAPPLIQDRGGARAGLWLSLFLTGQPVGLSVGYIYGSRMALSADYGWDWAYYWICVATVPVVLALACVRDQAHGGLLSGPEDVAGEEAPGAAADAPLLARTDDDGRPRPRSGAPPRNTLRSGIRACLRSPILVALSLGWAAIIGVVASVGTFGGAFVVALQLFDDERDAAYWFGIAVALAGVIGTPLGGRLADRVLRRYGGADAVLGGEGPDAAGRYPAIASLVGKILLLDVASLVFIFPTLAMGEAAYFLTFLFFGWTPLCESRPSRRARGSEAVRDNKGAK